MSKLSEPLKAFINAAHARPNTTPAPRHIASVYERIAKDAGSKQVGLPAWLTASVREVLGFLSRPCMLTTRTDGGDDDAELATVSARTVRPSNIAKPQQRAGYEGLDC